MKLQKRIGLVAHDNRKKDLMEWVGWNHEILSKHKLICTGTTGKLVEETLLKHQKKTNKTQIDITRLKSGPLGGDQQLGALIAEGGIDLLIFFWDPMQAQPHDVDVKALLRITVLYNIPTACNRSSADFLISSPLLMEEYEPIIKDYSSYINRKVE
jgi:methylglyoxal synthase